MYLSIFRYFLTTNVSDIIRTRNLFYGLSFDFETFTEFPYL